MARMKARVALGTGAGRGIGRSIALAFAQEGARVVVTSSTNSELDEVVAAIQEEGSEALAIAADMSDRKVPCQVIEQVQKTYGPVEVLVINAAVGSSSDPNPEVDFDDAFWDLSLAVNLTAPYLLAKAVLPQMIDRQHGRIITVASINSKIGSFH